MADRSNHLHRPAIYQNLVDGSVKVPERLGEAESVGEQVGSKVVGGGIAAQRVVGSNQEQVE